MAKGKQASKAANRRLEATRDHVDRLTEQLAEAKIRARDAEKRAAEADLLRQRVRELERRIDDGPTEAILDKLRWWDTISKQDRQRRSAALKELIAWFNGPGGSPGRLTSQLTPMERFEVLCGVLPNVVAALEAQDVSIIRSWAKDGVVWRGDNAPCERSAARRWYAFVRKERHLDEALVPDVIDLLSGLQEGFSADEIKEMIPSRFEGHH